MKTFGTELRRAALVTLVLALVCCGVYPLTVFGLGQLFFPARANGTLIVDSSGAIRGSRLIGQPFTAPRYFHPRPSAAGNGYDALASGGSNLGPTSQKLRDAIQERIQQYRQDNGLASSEPVPADAVTASASGLDPCISLANAELQVPRVARARGLSVAVVHDLVARHTAGRDLGFLGVPGVNVLTLNLALAALPPPP